MESELAWYSQINTDDSFCKFTFIPTSIRLILEELLHKVGEDANPYAFLDAIWKKVWIEQNLIQKGSQIYFKLGTFGDEEYYAVIEKNRMENAPSPMCLTAITKKSPDTIQGLKGYALFTDEVSFLKEIKRMALKENWTDFGLDNKYENNILKNYLDVTFSFLLNTPKNGVVESSDHRYSAFNTGLVDGTYDDIYIVFSKLFSKQDKKEWKYVCCTTARMSNGKHYLDHFKKLPERAKYSEISELFLIPGKITSDFEHIFGDNFDRFPIEFIKKELSPEDDFKDFLCKKPSPESIKKYIISHQNCFSRISDAFERTVQQSIRRWKWNYRTAVPMYFPSRQKIQFLLPLYFSGNQAKLDAALVLDKMPRNGEYRGVTILTPSMAYLDARLLCRPDSDWLLIETNNVIEDNKKYVFTVREIGQYGNIKGVLSEEIQGISRGSISASSLRKLGIDAADSLIGKKLDVFVLELNPQKNSWLLEPVKIQS